MAEYWYPFCLDEIDKKAALYPRRLRDKDKEFLNNTVRPRVKETKFLSPAQEKWLLDIRQRMTEPTRVKW